MATISKGDLKKLRKRRARLKKKTMECPFCPDGVVPRPVYVDYKDTKMLRTLIDREGRILPRRRTGTSAIYQRAVRTAVIRARFISIRAAAFVCIFWRLEWIDHCIHQIYNVLFNIDNCVHFLHTPTCANH